MVFTQANWGGLICILIRCKHWVHSSIHQLAKLGFRKREEKHFISHKDVIFEVRYTIYDVRYTMCDIRCAIYDVRYAIYEVLYMMYEIRLLINDFRF